MTYYSAKGKKLGRVRVYGKMTEGGWTWYSVAYFVLYEPWATSFAKHLKDHGIHVKVAQRGRTAGEPHYHVFVPQQELSPIPGLYATWTYKSNPGRKAAKNPKRQVYTAPGRWGQWYEGPEYNVRIGEVFWRGESEQTGRVDVEVLDKATGQVHSRTGLVKMIGNFSPIWINWKGKKVLVEDLAH